MHPFFLSLDRSKNKEQLISLVIGEIQTWKTGTPGYFSQTYLLNDFVKKDGIGYIGGRLT